MATLDELLVRIGIDDDTEEGASRVRQNLGRMAKGAGIAGAAVGLALSEGISSAMDISEAQTQLTAQLDLTTAEAKRAGSIAGDVFSAGYGESMADVSEAMRGVISNVGDMADTSNAEITSMSKTALALAKTMQFDVGEASQAAGTLMKSGLAKDGTEAFDLLTAAGRKLPPELASEIPRLTTEYAEFFDKIGATGPQMMGLLAESAKNPVFEIDKIGDAVKEFTLRIADTDAVAEPLKDLGLDVSEIQELVNKGQGTQAFDQIVKALSEVEDQTEATSLIFDLMGGPGEDAETALLALGKAGGFAKLGLDGVDGSAQKMKEGLEASPAMQMEQAMRTLKTTLGEQLLPVLTMFAGILQNNQGLLKQLMIPALIALVAVFVILTAATIAWTIALLANPIVLIVLAIIALIAIFVALEVKFKVFSTLWKGTWGLIKTAASAAWNFLRDSVFGPLGRFFTQTIPRWAGMVRDAVVGAWDSAVARVRALVGGILSWVTAKWNAWLGFFQGLPGKISRAASGMWDGLKSSFRSAVNFLISGWNNLSFTIGGGSIAGVSIPSVTLSTPNIPFLGDGGITTGATLAVIGEGPEQEAVMPLSKLEQMINTPEVAPSTGKVERQHMTIGFEQGGEDLLADLLQEIIRVKFGGDVSELGQEV